MVSGGFANALNSLPRFGQSGREPVANDPNQTFLTTGGIRRPGFYPRKIRSILVHVQTRIS
jgi:hypothetical protein